MIPQSVKLIDGFHTLRTTNREEWLTNAAVILRPWFEKRGYVIPERVRIGVGAMAVTRKTLGMTWTRPDRQGYVHITISSFVGAGFDAVDTLCHELVHAILPPDEGHGKEFRAACKALGLTSGKPTSAGAGPELAAHIRWVVSKIGPYPHAATSGLDVSGPRTGGGGAGGNEETDEEDAPSPVRSGKWKFYCPGCKSLIRFDAKPKTLDRQPELLNLELACSYVDCERVGAPMTLQSEF